MRRASMFARFRCSTALLAATLLFAGGTLCRAAELPAAKLDRGTVPAAGKHSALLSVNAFGRYALTVKSTQGVAVQAMDRMAGAGPISGEAGKQDGRLDLFLDRGEQKIVTYGAERGSGSATLQAHAFRELHEQPPLLVEHRLEPSSLGDFEQRSYWIEIKSKRVVALEAAGRYLGDLRLWRDGTWLVDATPQIVKTQAHPEQPLAVARLSAELPPGLYLLTAYGGPGQPWTEASEAKPLFLRFGIPTMGPAMRQQFVMSEFGVDRFVVPAGPTHFRLELPAAREATLQVGDYAEKAPFVANGQSASIDKKSLPPVAELAQGTNGERLVTVRAEPGKPYVLQYFQATQSYRFDGPGSFWLSSIHAGHAEDSVGASAVLTRWARNSAQSYGSEVYVADQAIDLDQGARWHRRFNLLDSLTLFVKVSSTRKIAVVGEGVQARYRFEPFVTSRPRDYKSPPWQPSGHVFELDQGLYVLNVEPETRGILDLHLLPPGAKPDAKTTPVTAAARFFPMSLEKDGDYTLYLNQQPGVASGAIVRRLPIDLAQPLPVSQKPGETLTIPVAVPERGTLRALAEDGTAIDLALDNGKQGAAIEVERGQYKVSITAKSAALSYSLGFEPTRLASRTPLPQLPDGRLAGLPKFPLVTPETPRYLDLKRHSEETFEVRVDKPGLYQFESTGLLHTGGKVRTRVNPSLFEETENGVGRNFLIQRYLREGNYQLTLATQGETQGHLGVQLARTDIVDSGELREGEVARAVLPTGGALAYRFRIAKRGRYHLQAMGLGRNFDVRLEDEHGWPVFAPTQSGDLTEDLPVGNYRLLILPQTVAARVLTRLDRVVDAKRYKGHGPHRLALETPVEHTWREPAKGKARLPDQWAFVLPAPAEVTVVLDNEMEATLVAAAQPSLALAKVNARQPWRGELAAGRYLLRAQHSRSNNFVTYSLRVSASQLMAGQSRTVATPATIPVSVGTDGLVELESFGASDVRARLFDAAGEVIAQNDDRDGDWNFQIVRRLNPGQYKLLVEPVGAKRAQTTLAMRAPVEVGEKALPLGSDVEIKDDRVHVYPLTVPVERNVLLASARSGDAVGIALEGESTQGWLSLGTQVGRTPHLVLPLGAERFKAYRLRAWNADRRSLRMSVRVAVATLAPAGESQWLQGGVVPRPVDDKLTGVKVAMISLSRPGAFRLLGDPARLAWSDANSRVAEAGDNPVIGVGGKTLWLVAGQGAGEGAGDGAAMRAERLRLPTGDQESLRLELMPGQIGSVDMQANAQGPSLLLAQARAVQPGIVVGETAVETAAETRNPNAMGFVPGEAVAVALPGVVSPVRVWNATSGAAAELDMRQVPLQQLAGQAFAEGVSDGAIKAHGALPVKLPVRLPGAGFRVRLTLSPMNAAVFVKRGAIVSTHWAGDDALQETVSTDAESLWLLNGSASDARYSAEISPDDGAAEATLKPGDLFERNVGTTGRLRVPVQLPKSEGDHRDHGDDGDYHLRVRGNTEALWQEEGGRIESGNDITIRASGVLWLRHQPGTIVAWLDEPKNQAGEPAASRLKSLQETAVQSPRSVSLKGKQQVLSFNLDKVTMLHVRTEAPVATQFLVAGQPAQTEAHLNGANINLVAPVGTSRLLLRALGAESLSGVANVMATPVTQLADGPGPEVLLAPGSARLFAFDLKQAATVGIGVRASSDVVKSVLYDEHGTVQAQGVVQMPSLAPGRYYLTIEMPADSAPVRVQPMVIGLAAPDTRPPFDILHRYVEATEASDALIYEPPPPAPPPGTEAEAEPDEAAPDAGDGAQPEAEPDSESGEMPVEEVQQ